MRRLPTVIVSSLLAVPVVVAIPVFTRPATTPHAVAPHVASLAVQLPTATPVLDIPGASATTDATATTGATAASTATRVAHALDPASGSLPAVATSAVTHTASFTLVGASWPQSLPSADTVQVRVAAKGGWSAWTSLSAEDAAPDPNSTDATAAARTGRGLVHSAPLWTGSADGVQTRVLTAAGTHSSTATVTAAAAAVQQVALTLVNPGTSSADSDPGGVSPADTAAAAATEPAIYTRAEWGADEALRGYNGASCETPSYSSTVKVAIVHHTDGTNDYAPDDVPAIIRAIYAYHVEGEGWCDIGYNFLIDRFGRIWEGRYGGVTRAVIGAHAGGFNTDTVGTALIGDFASVTPDPQMTSALEHLLAWKLAANYDNPIARTTLVSGGGIYTAYPAGTVVVVNVISGHRDVNETDCPGQAAYNLLPSIRAATAALVGQGLVSPQMREFQTLRGGAATVVFTSALIQASSWTFTVRNAAGATVAVMSGTGLRSTADGIWNGTTSTGAVAGPGAYTATLQSGTSVPDTLPFTIEALPNLFEINAAGSTKTPNATVSELSGATRWASPVLTGITPFTITNASDWQFLIGSYNNDGAADLYAIGGIGPDYGVWVMLASTNYTAGVHYGIPIATAIGDWQFALASYGGDKSEDLYAIRNYGGGSGHVEVHVLSASSLYQTFLLHAATPLLPTATGAWSYLVDSADAQLLAVSRAGTGSGHVEVHSLTQQSDFHTFSGHRVTPLVAQPAGTEFSVAAVTLDEHPDLIAAALSPQGNTTLTVISATSAYHTAVLSDADAAGPLDPSEVTVRLGL